MARFEHKNQVNLTFGFPELQLLAEYKRMFRAGLGDVEGTGSGHDKIMVAQKQKDEISTSGRLRTIKILVNKRITACLT